MLTKIALPTGLSAAALAWAGPALAQAGDGYGYHHGAMWGGGWGGGMIFGPLLLLLFIAVATAVVVLVGRAMMRGGCCGHRHGHGRSNAMALLEERFAKGEIDAAEFNERKKALLDK